MDTSPTTARSFSSPHSVNTSTPASSPPPDGHNGVSDAMQKEEDALRRKRDEEEAKHDELRAKEMKAELAQGAGAVNEKFKRLDFLLKQSTLYANIMLEQMQKEEQDEEREEKAEKAAEVEQRRTTRRQAAQTVEDQDEKPKRGRGRPSKDARKDGKISNYFKKEDVQAAASAQKKDDSVKTSDVGIQNMKSARQPSLVTGGTMRGYQLEGLEWLFQLYSNGVNGILADEMGLGKTIQTIAFLALLREKKSYGPFLIAAPLSTTTNWVSEFKKWTPSIPVILYHGSKREREEIRRKKLRNPGSPEFPVVVTSYEICMNDRKYLANFGWTFLVIDEGHRIKNLDCRLIRELQNYRSANRLLITGTPLQNNLTELWSLLHFLMPDIFTDLGEFESWFDFSSLKDRKSYDAIFTKERKDNTIAKLHAILRPFLLRRVKTDVEKLLPKKREYVLYAPLTQMQKELYKAIMDGTGRSYLEEKAIERLSMSGTATPSSVRSSSVGIKRKLNDSRPDTPNKSARTSRDTSPGSTGRGLRGGKKQNYEELSDMKYFKKLEEQPESEDVSMTDYQDEEELIRECSFELAKKQIAAKKMQHPLMQLRLCCNHPYNFFNPFDVEGAIGSSEHAGEPDETVVTTSGKMIILDQLLPALFKGHHKVLIFSQFKMQLDILGDYCDLRGWNYCRIDGSVPQSERQEQIDSFNRPSGKKDAVNVFLLSTRAGGQGINLAAADTVILYDSDFNPQQDLQAQDRAHRIGQTRNVIVYRLATRGTVEEGLLEAAEAKRRLEKLVIKKGSLRDQIGLRKSKGEDEVAELQRLLGTSDGETFEWTDGEGVLSERDLKILTDRSDGAYERAAEGLDVGEAFKAVEARSDEGLLEGLKV